MNSESRRRLAAETNIVPRWAWVLAAVAFVGAQLFFNFFDAVTGDLARSLRLVLGATVGVGGSGYILFVGYINADASRRQMSAALWTLVAILIPHGLGIVLYFLLRQPLSSVCPQCAATVEQGAQFCPRCSYKLRPSCPQCQREVRADDAFCPHCAAPLEKPGGTVLRFRDKPSVR
jgi:hypothetical protein